VQYGPDAVRYYFLRAVPFGRDGDFTQGGFEALYSADLANGFGNLVQRVTTLAVRRPGDVPRAECSQAELDLRARAEALPARLDEAFEALALHEAAIALGEFVRGIDRYLDATKPWTLRQPGRVALVLDEVVQSATVAARYYTPFIPRAATEALRRLTRRRTGPPLFPRLEVPGLPLVR
jgi:methionyl-tRNA synthetase